MFLLVQTCKKARVFGIFWGAPTDQTFTKVRDLRQNMRKVEQPKISKARFLRLKSIF